MRQPARVATAVLVLASVVAIGRADAGPPDGVTDGPTITVDRPSINPGDRVLVTLDGFEGTAVTISVCGNRARRGSADCNLTASEGLGLDLDGSSTLTEFPVAAPSTTCPCVIVASTTNYNEVAVTPIELIGHPVGPVVGALSLEPLVVTVESRRAPQGIVANIRAALGGPTAYEVTVSVRNRSTATLENIAVDGSARRGAGDVASLVIPSPGPLEPGQTWTEMVRTQVPAPAVGRFVFAVTASGAGPAVSAESATSHLPIGLLILVIVLLVDVVAMVWRRKARRHRDNTALVAEPALA